MSTRRRHILSGFMAGELDPHLEGRIDTDQYQYGLARCENWVAINEGPLVKRQGFEMIREADDTATWLTAFRPSIEREYVVEWGEEKLRFFTNEARIETAPGVAYEVATPFTAAQAPYISAQQSFDRQYLAHPGHAPRAIRRDSLTTFTLETIENVDGPFLDMNTDETRTISASAVSGTGVTLTGNGGFQAGHVGALMRIEAIDFADITQWEPGMADVAIGNLVRNRGRVYQAQTAGTTGTFEPEHSEGAAWDGQLKRDLLNDKGPWGVRWQYLHDRFGLVRITAVASATSATCTVLRRLPNSLTTQASWRWAHGAFSDAEGWPSLVTLYKGRLIHFKGIDIIGSVAGDFGGGRVNYAAFTESGRIEVDLGFRRTIGLADPPVWVSADRQLLIGTASLEMAISPQNSTAAFSGLNIEAEPQSYYGSENVFPVTIGTETLFVERGGRRVRAADYDFGRDRYDAPDLNATSRHITMSGIRQLGYQRVPHALAYAVRGDGEIIVHAKTRAEIRGWTRFKLGGGARALSAVSVVGSDGKSDDLWLLIERENGEGDTVKEIWKQARWRELDDDVTEAFFVDGGVRIEASGGVGSFAGLDHLAGQSVAVLANGAVVPDMAVEADGSLTLPANVVPSHDYIVIVGLAYSAVAMTMRPEPRDERASISGRKQRIVKAITRVLDTLGLQITGPGGTPEELELRRGGQAMDQQKPLVSDDLDGLPDAEFDTSGRTIWISDRPLPATITMVMQNIDVDQRDA
jgi:hypothetical protein